jgi:hypothetical protein
MRMRMRVLIWRKSVVDGEVVNKKEKSHEREGWKVLGFGIAWFWLFTSST